MHEYDVQIRWQNFRSFRDTGWLQIKPITVLIGANNSGKTSVLAPLLVLNQTLKSLDGNRALITRGDLVDIGTYKDLIHNHDTDLPLSLAVGFHLHNGGGEEVEPIGTYPPGALELTFEHTEDEDIVLKRYAALDLFKRPYFSRTKNRTGSFVLRGSISTKKMSRSEKLMLRRVRPTNFYFSPSQTLYRPTGSKHSSRSRSAEHKFTDSFSHYVRAISHVHMALQDFFFPLSYVGPIRTWPKRHYEVLREDRLTVGPKGQHAAALLHDNEDVRKRLDGWVHKFGFGEGLKFLQLIDDFFEVKFTDSGGQLTNIVDAGFGASQLLPLLVQGLTMQERAIFAAEQPEIHLNPRIQGTLADLFVEMASAGNRVVIETHSEHFVLRLRRLVAEGKIAPDHVALYFVERENADSSIREVPIEQNGHIPRDEWPKGFFQDALRESLALSTAQAKWIDE